MPHAQVPAAWQTPVVLPARTSRIADIARCTYRPSVCRAQSCSDARTPVHDRRTVLRTMLLAPVHLFALRAARASDETVTTTESTAAVVTHVSPGLGVSLTYPASWFLSSRSKSLVVCDLRQSVVATVAWKTVELSKEGDAFAVAYEMVRDRVEREGATIFLKEAVRGDDGVVAFRFEVQTAMPDGSNVMRVGTGRALPKGQGYAFCIVTAPWESWEGLRGIAGEVVGSLTLV